MTVPPGGTRFITVIVMFTYSTILLQCICSVAPESATILSYAGYLSLLGEKQLGRFPIEISTEIRFLTICPTTYVVNRNF